MNINLNKTLEAIRKALAEKELGVRELKQAYQETLRLQSQIFASDYKFCYHQAAYCHRGVA